MQRAEAPTLRPLSRRERCLGHSRFEDRNAALQSLTLLVNFVQSQTSQQIQLASARLPLGNHHVVAWEKGKEKGRLDPQKDSPCELFRRRAAARPLQSERSRYRPVLRGASQVWEASGARRTIKRDYGCHAVLGWGEGINQLDSKCSFRYSPPFSWYSARVMLTELTSPSDVSHFLAPNQASSTGSAGR